MDYVPRKPDERLFVIEYYSRVSMRRERYMNNSAWPTQEQAERQIELIKREEKKRKS